MNLRVVLAEDDLDIQFIASETLERSGFAVIVAANGVETLACVTQEQPDVVLLDWMMPVMDGLETCRRLKRSPATQHIPIIFLSAKSQESELQQGLSLGAIGYITKPFDALSLGQRIRDLLRRS